VDQVIALVGLSNVARKHVGGFSLGMRQRLGIATALLGDPDTLILDEPINGLDPEGVRWVRNLLKSLATEGRTVFLSSHLISELALTAEHVIVVGKGRLIADVAVAELLAGASANAAVRVRSPQAAKLRGLLALESRDVVYGEWSTYDTPCGWLVTWSGHRVILFENSEELDEEATRWPCDLLWTLGMLSARN
jgi:ABC-type multidrug transport system ATPase subunit